MLGLKIEAQTFMEYNSLSLRNYVFKLCLFILEHMVHILSGPDVRLYFNITL
jgi:hypothetical protein